jgi:hypothetical protein
MYEVKYEYAIDEFGVYTHIKDVDKNKSYHLLVYGDKIDMIPAMGEYNQWHFRTKNSNYAGMSPQHWNLQAKLIAEKSFYSREFDITITANDAKSEYILSNGRIVDVAYFDTNNDFLCGIEVVHTNDIDREKQQDLYNSNYLIFKVYTNAPERFTFVDNKKIEEEIFREHYTKGTQKFIESEPLLWIYFEEEREHRNKLFEINGKEGELIKECRELEKEYIALMFSQN